MAIDPRYIEGVPMRAIRDYDNSGDIVIDKDGKVCGSPEAVERFRAFLFLSVRPKLMGE
jgi:hypothetical protein